MTANRARPLSSVIESPSPRAWIDFAKGTAIILVVLYHSSLFLSEVDLAGSTPRLRAFLSFIPMAVFLFIAGLTAARTVTWSFAQLWRRRLSGLIYLYLLWSALRVIFYLVVPHVRESERAPTDVLTIALVPIWPTSSYWFIWALALFALIAWLVRRVPVWLQLTLSGLLAVASSTPGLLDTNNVGWDRVFQNLFFFLIALYGASQLHQLVEKVRIWHVVVLAVAYVFMAILLIPFHGARIPGLVLVEGAIAIALTVSASTLLVRVRWLAFVSALGRASLTIYLIHVFVIALVVALVAPISASAPLVLLANFLPIGLAIIALGASLLLGRFLRRMTWLWVNPFRPRQHRRGPTPAADSPAAMASPPSALPLVLPDLSASHPTPLIVPESRLPSRTTKE